MAKNPNCKMCNSYHYERDSFFDKNLDEIILFCSSKCKNEYINKKSNPNFKTSNDKFMDEINERNQNARDERNRKFDDIDNFYEKNPNGDYHAYEKKSKNTGGFFSDLLKDDPIAAARKQREVDEENAQINAWLRKYWRFWVPALIMTIIIIGIYLFVGGNSNKFDETSYEMESSLMDSVNIENEKTSIEFEKEIEEAEKDLEKNKNTEDEDIVTDNPNSN
jgi:hypothetical protein